MMFFLYYDSVSLPNPTTLRQTNIAGWKMDPIEIGDIPASYVSLPECQRVHPNPINFLSHGINVWYIIPTFTIKNWPFM